MADAKSRLTRQHISDSVGDIGWRYMLGVLRTSVRVESPAHAAALAAVVTTEAGEAAGSLLLDLRPDRVVVSLQDGRTSWVTELEIAAARRISDALTAGGLRPDPDVGASDARSVQLSEIAIDAMDISAIRPFWRAVLGYGDEPGHDGAESGGPPANEDGGTPVIEGVAGGGVAGGGAIVDPQGQGPAVWFQQMDEPRRQRNRIHFDVSVPHDEAASRIAATIAAGGVLLSDAQAPAFWVLADAEGNEACVTTWQGRDPVQE
jgi:4a-hydroxytetrahydrobiopterin dehydratase